MENAMGDDNGAVSSEIVEGDISAFARVIRVIFRILLVSLIGVILGVAIYFSVQVLYRDYIEPMQATLQRIPEIEEELAQDKAITRKQMGQIGERLAEIEGQLAEQGETLAILLVETDRVLDELEDQDDRIDRLRNMADQVEVLSADLNGMIEKVETLEITLSDVELPTQPINLQLRMIRAMTVLCKARLWLTEDNLGLAAEEIENARDLLASVPEVDSIEGNELLEQIIERLNLALADVRTIPIVAADELEIAWKLMLEVTEPETLTPDISEDKDNP
jgi:chromosome segregation ATPase